MCILCSVQKWARNVSMMLPWLVVPLIGLWVISLLLPPDYRFEITSPRLACVIVLIVTLAWYEFLMPQLLAWRVRRNARLREKKRSEAIELQKLRKTATRRCRNCLTPYRDQNPGGGRFMCSYCGHLSKRPVLDLLVPPGMSNLSSGILKELVEKSGNILNGKTWFDNGWICNGQDNLENTNWIGGSLPVRSLYWRNSEGLVCGLNDSCITEKSYSRVVISACKLLRSSLTNAWWLWRKIFRVGPSHDDASLNGECGGNLPRRGENGSNFQESKIDKARRKAEEKRQARLEKEQLEEEERRQREEVVRLVEERRKLGDESEKGRVKCSGPVKDRRRKEAENTCQERKKERDRGSCKSNSDAEELERKLKESNQKKEPERKGDSDRCESQRSGVDSGKGYNMEPGQSKGVTASYSRVNTGARYLDHMRGTFFSSPKAFSRGSLFGRTVSNHTVVSKENRFTASMDHSLTHGNRKDTSQSDLATGSVNSNGGDRQICKPVLYSTSTTAPRKSWGQLFSCSSTAVPSATSNVISRPHTKDPSDIQKPFPDQPLPAQSYDNPLSFGLPSPFSPSFFQNMSINTSSGFHYVTKYIFPLPGGSPQKFLPEEPELFEDPCYVPDPVSLLGPVSESLDNFQLDLGTGFGAGNAYEKLLGLNNASAPCEVIQLSSIESPLSRLRVSDDRHSNLSWNTNTQKAQNMHDPRVDDSLSNNENGTWQMWNSSPLVQDGIIGGGSFDWLSSDDSPKEENVRQSSVQPMGSLLSNNHPVISGTNSPVKSISRNSYSDWGKPFFHYYQTAHMMKLIRMKRPLNQQTALVDQFPENPWSKNQWAASESGEGF